MNTILVVVDSLRKDKVGAYSNTKSSLTPNIDSLAKNGAILDNHFTVLNGSTPVQISMFTGLYPSKHGVHENGYKLPENLKTLAEYLSENNFITCGIVSSGAIGSVYNFNKGFKYFYDNSKYDKLTLWAKKQGTIRYKIRKFLRNTLFKFGFFDKFVVTYDKTNKRVLNWLDMHHDKNFFLYIQYFDIHEDTYGERNKSKDKVKNYDENVKIVDSAIGEIINKLKEFNIFEDTLFIITADHGEDLSEENVEKAGKTQHGKRIAEDEFGVPCILHKPGLIPVKKVDNLTRVIDLLPTILDLNNINLPNNVDGVSIKKSIFEDINLIDEVFLESYPLFGDIKGIRTKEWLYILRNGNEEELYDVMSFKNNIAEENKDLCLKFKVKVKNHFSIKYEPGERDEYTKQMLSKLGYVK